MATAPARQDDRPPADARYQQALQPRPCRRPRGGDGACWPWPARQRGTSAGAALYQAGIAARGRATRRRRIASCPALRRDYPGHPLALRSQPAPPPVTRPRPASDCGPRALALLCGQAGLPADLADLTRRCGTTKEGTTLEGLAQGARGDRLPLRRRPPRRPVPPPPAAGGDRGWVDGSHYVAFLPGSDGGFWLLDPNEPGREPVDAERLASRSQGIVLLLAWGSGHCRRCRRPATRRLANDRLAGEGDGDPEMDIGDCRI